jgi:hypothetical protein
MIRPPFSFCVSSKIDIHDMPASLSAADYRGQSPQLKIDWTDDVSNSNLSDIMFSGKPVAE